MAILHLDWTYTVIQELSVQILTTVIFYDNQGAVRIFTSETSTSRTRHLDIRLQFTKQHILSGKYKIRYITSQDNVADCFTKPLYRMNFERLVNRLLIPMPSDPKENKPA